MEVGISGGNDGRWVELIALMIVGIDDGDDDDDGDDGDDGMGRGRCDQRKGFAT